jgi:hypothetical protein
VQQHIDTDCPPGIAVGRGCIQSGNKHHNPERNPQQDSRDNIVHCIDFCKFMLFWGRGGCGVFGRYHIAILGITGSIYNGFDNGFVGIYRIEIPPVKAVFFIFVCSLSFD